MKNKSTHLVLVTESKSEHLQQKAEYFCSQLHNYDG